MKISLKIFIYVTIIIFITLILCIVFIKPKTLNLKVTEEYEYIQKNKKNIEEVIIRNDAQLGTNCYKLDTNKAYEILNNIEIKKETKMWCSSGTMHLEFKFNDGTKKSFYFDCENLVYDNTHYELKEDVILVNKDEYIPDKITNTMIVVENKDEVECK